MISKIKILIFPGEAENAFELYHALRFSTRFEIWGGSSEPGYGNLLFDNYSENLPKIKQENFLQVFNQFIETNNIQFIIPTHDDVALYLAEHQQSISATLIGSNAECALLCRNKNLLYAAVAQHSFCPTTYTFPEDVQHWPVFIKPNQGQGGVGGARVDDFVTLQHLWRNTPDPVICEYLPGEEFTIDCFTDRHGTLLFVGPRTRDVVKMGIAFVSRTVEVDAEMQHIAATLNTTIRPRGLWFFQVKRDEVGRLKLLEASCRTASGMSVYRQLGVNLPLLAAYDAISMDISILKNDLPLTMRRRLHSSYTIPYSFDAVYVDYDDTLIVNGKVNAQLMQFLYTCKNQGKHLFLLTRHPGDLLLDMQKSCIPEQIFTEIHHLKTAEKKSEFIQKKSAIFIDNLFTERADVLNTAGIPVFDVDAVEGLL
ncbi:ATP-grasp domain-containing protein [Comamonas aquatica]|uniref:ATP-grasp domain-containing protein n=1 Tax=Comamonas aquatica TaxID=225991 RepID=UPI00244D5A54|nr:ATP-grasp domain-containing protein [Comamonas aquatica]MDH0382979.1 ATP-grasp domain-containing protein [Comamonas aquatica]MDH0431046.1 ATP-grasp domain-containing protein [Comamonas aquatica]MDH0942088.1 ATP-grasp domain-containing protein [Comamonas aquatica]